MSKSQKMPSGAKAQDSNGNALERRRSQDALRQNEHRLRLALDSAEMGTWDWNLTTDAIQWDQRQYQLFGTSPDNFSGLGSDAIGLIHPEDQAHVRAIIEQALNKSDVFGMEFRVRHPDGSLHWLAGRGQPLMTATDGSLHLIGVNFDITEHKQLEQERAEYARLEDKAQMHRLHVAGEIAALLAHQLNQPLAAIRSFAEARLARLRRGDFDMQEAVSTMQDIVEQSERAAKSIRDLRKFLARQPQAMVEADLNAEVRAACKLMEVLARGRKIRLRMKLEESMPLILMRPSQIEQVIVNLIENAMDAMADAGHRSGTIEIGTRHEAAKNQVLACVEDSGPGLAADAVSRVFEPLYTTKKNGIGMGLVISRSIIEGHGGRIWAEPGEAGRFLFALPVSQ
ncbi:PAS domain-containing protein [Betaproteobacteria bacterium SCN2]|jgi:PAS domain S-box-containing protein|nr:PAS domain-containing protein [Betaproteobacteria bacterium SCN2]